MYVGSAINVGIRWSNHLVTLRNKTHHNRFLQRAWNKYGESSFRWLVVETVSNAADLIAREQHWIDALKAANPRHGYNLAPTAGSSLGVKHTAVARHNMSEAARRRPPRPREILLRLITSRKGKKNSPEHNAKISAALRGQIIPPEARAKMSAAKKGIVWTAEQIARRLAWTKTPEGHAKFVSMNIGKKRSIEQKAAMSKARKGRKLSQEHRAKITAANLARWAKYRASFTLPQVSPATTLCPSGSDQKLRQTEI